MKKKYMLWPSYTSNKNYVTQGAQSYRATLAELANELGLFNRNRLCGILTIFQTIEVLIFVRYI